MNANELAWLAVFYPETAGDLSKRLHASSLSRADQDRATLTHSLRKWTGAKPEVLRAFDLEAVPIFFDAETCALCELDSARRTAGQGFCDNCPLAESRDGTSCTRQWGQGEPTGGPFAASSPEEEGTDPQPMLAALLHAWRWIRAHDPRPEPDPTPPPGRKSRSFARFGYGDGSPAVQLRRLAGCLAEAHAEEMESGHCGDAPEPGPWPAGCSYCHAISIAPETAQAVERDEIALDGIARTLAENEFNADLLEPLELILESTGRQVPDLMQMVLGDLDGADR